MKYMIRIAAVVLVFPAALFFSYWIFAAILFSAAGEENFSMTLNGVVIALSLTTSVVSSVYTWKKAPQRAPRDMQGTVLLGALILGSVGFIGGFFGPILLGGGNQGPLLGIFFTGPLGLAIGAVTGMLIWKFRQRKAGDAGSWIPENAWAAALIYAAVVGGMGIILGVLGPLIFEGGTKGPFLGIFVTGPAGAVLGGLGGLIAWYVRKTKSAHSVPS